MKRADGPSAAGKAEKVAVCSFKREPGYLYFLNKQGDVERRALKRGGTKRS